MAPLVGVTVTYERSSQDNNQNHFIVNFLNAQQIILKIIYLNKISTYKIKINL